MDGGRKSTALGALFAAAMLYFGGPVSARAQQSESPLETAAKAALADVQACMDLAVKDYKKPISLPNGRIMMPDFGIRTVNDITCGILGDKDSPRMAQVVFSDPPVAVNVLRSRELYLNYDYKNPSNYSISLKTGNRYREILGKALDQADAKKPTAHGKAPKAVRVKSPVAQ